MGYFSIHNHTDYSNASLGFADSINRVEESVDYAIELGLSGYVLTDHEMLGGQARLLKYRDKLEEQGKITHENFTIGLGDEIYLVKELGVQEKYFHHLLIAKDKLGHKILRKISSQAWENSFTDRRIKRTPISRDQVEAIINEEGFGHIISSTACIGSFEGQMFLRIKHEEENGKSEKVINELKQEIEDFVLWNKRVFGEDFYLEIAPNISEEQRYVNNSTWRLGKAYGVPVVFSTDSHYLTEDDRAIHKAYLNSKQAEREVDDFYYTAYMMPEEKVKEYLLLDFSEEEFNLMLSNLESMRKKISHYTLFQEQQIPLVKVDVPELDEVYNDYDFSKYPDLKFLLDSKSEQNLYWSRMCLNQLFKKDLLNDRYVNQLNTEAHTLKEISARLNQDMTGYYNLAQRMIDIMWSEGDSLVGISRGSAFGFLSNYLLGITQMDPLPYVGDLSWRHLSKDRPELPDCDIDSQGTKREQIIQAFKDYFGHDKVLNVATFGTEKTKKALATAARGLDISDDVSSYLSGMIVNERGFDRNLHDTYYGNPDKGYPVNAQFRDEIDKYPMLFETALRIEGMISSLGSHASALYIYNQPYTELNAMMKTQNGLEITQWDYRDSDSMGSLKMDNLSIEGLDRIRSTMDLLIKDGRMEWQGSLKATYDKYLHPDVLDYSEDMYKPAWRGEVINLFQMETAVGGQAVKNGKPKTLMELSSLNSLMRLMAQDGQELPLDKFIRFKNNIQLWYQELRDYDVPEDEVEILERHYLPVSGVISTQEDMMLVLMNPKLCGFTAMEANKARKLVGKKQMDKIPALREKIFSQAVCSPQTTQYLWDTAIQPQLGYGFSNLHSLAYSCIGLQELNLYNHYPSIYWNCGCLIVNSGDETGTSTDYAKMAVALGNTIKHGVRVEMVDINESEANFKPNVEKNYISYGFRPLTGIGYDFIQKIYEARPFTSLKDFIERVQPDKTQALTLIKSGAFRKIDSENRRLTLAKYSKLQTGKRKSLTITQAPLVREVAKIPENLDLNFRAHEFNRYVKEVLIKSGEIVALDERAQQFLSSIGAEDLIESWPDSKWPIVMSARNWQKYYDLMMNPIRDYLSENKQELLQDIFLYEMVENFKLFGGLETESKWEMDSMNFYYTKHELADIDFKRYNIVNYDDLSREPVKINPYAKFSRNKLSSIVGTIIEKNKTKAYFSLLTPEGNVIMVKMYKGEFSYWDKQVSERQTNGTKKVLEKSFLQRGNKVYLTGFRRDDQFVPKTYVDTVTPKFGLITDVDEKDGTFSMTTQRIAN